MFALSNILYGLAQVLRLALTILWWLILIRALISWVNPDPYNPIVQILQKTTEPFLRPLRRIFPIYNIGIDLSPIIAILLIVFIRFAVVRTLIDLSIRFR